jgi:cold shock protein
MSADSTRRRVLVGLLAASALPVFAARAAEALSAAPAIKLTGCVKWFDVAKGYGFITPDDHELRDVLLHIAGIRRSGVLSLFEGTRVAFEAIRFRKGLLCHRILAMDDRYAIRMPDFPAPRTHVTVTPTSGLELATVKWFNRARGFGFLTRGEGTPDIFVHLEVLRQYGIPEMRLGQPFYVRHGRGPKGLMAAQLWPYGVEPGGLRFGVLPL